MWRDEAYLLDILIAARKVLRYVSDLSRELFKEDNLRQDAVIRNLQIIGEAARKISDEFRSGHPEIPWGEIVGMRNRLVHDYSRIDVAKIWDTAQEDIPSLIRWIEPLVPPEDKV
jgi:uncharacterized protein with HEPN domain